MKKDKHVDTVNLMKKEGYFHTKLEYEKAIKWVKTGLIPQWFLEDMKKFRKESENNGNSKEN